MKRCKWSIDVVNTLARLAGEMDSAAAINGAMMTSSERELFKNKLMALREEFYNKIK